MANNLFSHRFFVPLTMLDMSFISWIGSYIQSENGYLDPLYSCHHYSTRYVSLGQMQDSQMSKNGDCFSPPSLTVNVIPSSTIKFKLEDKAFRSVLVPSICIL